MPLDAGQKLGPYEIVALIGKGGMGEVYKATDTRLDRTVAIKVLPEHLPQSSEQKARFEREARTVSQLNHPHICTLHDVGSQDGTAYLVMEYIEGESLSDRLSKGPLTLSEALRFGEQILDALDTAHRYGVIHRDLKPANIMLTATGAKLLDFGLAKEAQTVESDDDAEAPTKSAALTRKGVLSGTLAYMAPEQLNGKSADARSDIFAFGVVLYEMLTSRKAFEAETPAGLIAAILEHEPSVVPESVPPLLENVLTTCLRKDPDERFQSARDLRLVLGWTTGQTTASGFVETRRSWLWPVATGAVVSALIASIVFRSEPESEILELAIMPPPGHAFGSEHLNRKSFALSPDGKRLAFVALDESEVALDTRGGSGRLWIRDLGNYSARPLDGTEGALYPFWAPAGDEVGFFSDRQVKVVGTSGGAPVTIGIVPNQPRGGTWGDNDVVLVGCAACPIYRVKASGEEPQPMTALDAGATEIEHTWPQLLPDGTHFIFFGRSAKEGKSGVYLGSLDDKAHHLLLPSDSNAIYAAPGYLLFQYEGGLRAHRFDAGSRSLLGEVISLPYDVELTRFRQMGASVSVDGKLAYSSGRLAQQLVWYSRDGRRLATLGPPGDHYTFRFSPDGSAVALSRLEDGGNLWLLDISGNVPVRLTSSATPDYNGMWSQDGSHLYFTSRRTGSDALYRMRAVAQAEPELLFTPSDAGAIRDVVEAESTIVYEANGGLFAHHLEGEWEDRRLAENAHATTWVNLVSPNGKWLAYSGNETGRDEIYVTAFPDAGRRWPVSRGGGVRPRWSADGSELYYISVDNRLFAVPVVTEETFRSGEPIPLFDLQGATHYDVAPDGQRFLVNVPLAEPPELNVVMDWKTALPN